MKKTYINPEIEIVKIEKILLQSGSPQGVIGEGTQPGSGAASRGDYWDDDE